MRLLAILAAIIALLAAADSSPAEASSAVSCPTSVHVLVLKLTKLETAEVTLLLDTPELAHWRAFAAQASSTLIALRHTQISALKWSCAQAVMAPARRAMLNYEGGIAAAIAFCDVPECATATLAKINRQWALANALVDRAAQSSN